MESKVILLVEDNPKDEALALRAFRKSPHSFDVVVAHDGVEALDMLLGNDPTQEALPALVLLDLKLPRLNGIEVLSQMRANSRTRHLPVVILSSSTEEQDIRQCYELGANSYLRKPVDYNKFVVAVESIGFYWLNLNEPPPSGGL